MQANTKTDAAGEQARPAAPVSLVSELARQGVDGALATQRIMLDLIMRQNATTMNALRQTLSTARTPKSAEGVAEMAAEGVSNFIEAQRVLLNTALQENEIVMNAVKDRTGMPVIADVVRRSIETFIDLQQHILTLAEKQTNSWMDQAKAGKSVAGGKPMAELLEDGMEQFVRSQKKLLDMISEEMAKATDSKKVETKKDTVPGLTDLISQSAGALIQMQKKLLDVAGKQVDVNIKAARRIMDAVKPSMSFNPAELARQYADNMVAAQKSMMDIIVKPRPAATRAETKAEARAPRRKPRKRAKKAAASQAASA